MNIENANVEELENYIQFLMARYSSSAQYYWEIFNNGSSRINQLDGYIFEIAELVEISWLSQMAFEKLIKADRRSGSDFALNDEPIKTFDQVWNNESLQDLMGTLIGRLHMCFAESHGVVQNFKFMKDQERDHREFYTIIHKTLADIHESTLIMQIAFSHILRLNNLERYKNR